MPQRPVSRARPGAALLVITAMLLTGGCKRPASEEAGSSEEPDTLASSTVPHWAADAVFYQIFPERFRNGDPSNDPNRESLEFPVEERVPQNWQVTPWAGDWYARADWERTRGGDFYEDGIFDRRYGGDLQGVLEKLDYLSDLGINTIYFNPIFYARSLHKYDGNTFHHVDPHFGPDPAGDFRLMEQETSDPSTWRVTAADSLFFAVLEEVHRRNIRIIIDGVWNHTGRDFFAFADIRAKQAASPYVDWYIVESFDDPETPENEFAYEGWWGVETLPVFADNDDGTDLHHGPKKYIFDATRKWMDPDGDGDPSDGIDGWRLDVTNEVPIGFWRDWNAMVRRINPEAYTVTEIWEAAREMIAEGGFSATMNYWAFAFPVNGFLIDRATTAGEFADLLDARREEYPRPVQYALQNLIDSHDTDRLASMIVNRNRRPYEQPERFDYDWGNTVSPRHNDGYDVRKPTAEERQIQRLVALFQMTCLGAPMIYYGTEAGMWGADDPDDRKPMIWPDIEYDPETGNPLGRRCPADSVQFDHDLFAYYRDVIRLRRERVSLRRGEFEVLSTDDERSVLAFARRVPEETIIVVLNRGGEAMNFRVELPEDFRGRYESIFVTPGPGHRLQQDRNGLVLELPGLSGIVLQRAGRPGGSS